MKVYSTLKQGTNLNYIEELLLTYDSERPRIWRYICKSSSVSETLGSNMFWDSFLDFVF